MQPVHLCARTATTHCSASCSRTAFAITSLGSTSDEPSSSDDDTDLDRRLCLPERLRLLSRSSREKSCPMSTEWRRREELSQTRRSDMSVWRAHEICTVHESMGLSVAGEPYVRLAFLDGLSSASWLRVIRSSSWCDTECRLRPLKTQTRLS